LCDLLAVEPDEFRRYPDDSVEIGWLQRGIRPRDFLSQVGQVRQSALEGKTAVKIYDARGELKQAQYHVLWPNFTININPGFTNLSLDVWIPDGPNHTKGFSEQYFGPGVSEEFAKELPWPKHVWLGTSVENADYVERIDHLRKGVLAGRALLFQN
jgi:hypothetical protein